MEETIVYYMFVRLSLSRNHPFHPHHRRVRCLLRPPLNRVLQLSLCLHLGSKQPLRHGIRRGVEHTVLVEPRAMLLFVLITIGLMRNGLDP